MDYDERFRSGDEFDDEEYERRRQARMMRRRQERLRQKTYADCCHGWGISACDFSGCKRGYGINFRLWQEKTNGNQQRGKG